MSTMTLHDLESFYDHLAETLDTVGREKSPVFLAKLVLLLAQQVPQPTNWLHTAIDDAASDL